MRRLWAFLTLLVSLVFGLVLIGQPIFEDANVSSEFENGTEAVYQISKATGTDDSTSLAALDIAGKLNARLDTAGLRGSTIELVTPDRQIDGSDAYADDTMEARISFSQRSDLQLSSLRRIIEGTGALTIATYDNYAMTGTDFFAEAPASLEYDSSNQIYLALKLTDDTVWKAMTDHASTLTEEDQKTKLYVWRDYDADTDTYEKAFSDDPAIKDVLVADKVLFTLDTSSAYDEANQAIKIAKDREWDTSTARKPWSDDGTEKSWDISSARAMVASLNASDYGFEIAFLYTVTVAPTFGTTAIIWAVAGFATAFALVFALLVVRYGVAGLIAMVTNATGLLFTVYLTSFLGFEFSSAYLCGLAVVALLGVAITVNYFERVKAELRKGRPIDKANKEGYRKSFLTTVDSTAVVFLVSLASFLIGKGMVKVGFGVAVIGAVFAFVLVNYFTKWLMYWLTTYARTGDPKLVFGFRSDVAKPLYDAGARRPGESEADQAERFGKTSRRVRYGFGTAFAVLALAVGIGAGVFAGVNGVEGTFNASSDYAAAYRVDVMTTATGYRNTAGDNVEFANATAFVAYLENGVVAQLAADNTDAEGNPQPLDVAAYEKATGLAFADANFSIVDVTTDFGTGSDSFRAIYASFRMPVLPENSEASAKRADALNTIGRDLDELTVNNGNSEALANAAIATTFRNATLQERYTPYLKAGAAASGTLGYGSAWLFVVLSLVGVFAGVYAGLRFGLSAGLSEFGLVAFATLLGVGVLLLARLPFASFTGYGLLAGALLAVLLPFPFFARSREILKEAKTYRTASLAERERAALTAVSQSVQIFVDVGLGLTVFAAGGLAIYGWAAWTMALSFFLIGLAALAFVVLALPYVYAFLRARIDIKSVSEQLAARRAKHPKKPRREIIADPNEARETEIPGLNDYRGF